MRELQDCVRELDAVVRGLHREFHQFKFVAITTAIGLVLVLAVVELFVHG